jgi:(1->4)-alpha-D-glucan 1-alpha-D-glucosylmutase
MIANSTTTAKELAVPRATYRLQFHEGFRLNDALALVPYLHALGISHLYASPLFKARPHSTHGYDICDFTQLNPELGTEADMEELVHALRARGMGLVLDIVPNHMGIGGPENRWWWDVLEHGPDSPFAKYFDIDWNPPDPRLRGKVLFPILGDRYNRLLARRELQVETREDTCLLRYGENIFPINAGSLKTMGAGLEELNANPDALDGLLEKQFYRLAWHGRGDTELNYRRFFNITTLPGLCMEDKEVFQKAFALTRQWLQRGWLDGLRVDHPDGLRDPQQFLERLKKLAPHAWIVVEKILEPGESLPTSWPVAGTTGYDFLNCVMGLFIDPNGTRPLSDLYRIFSGNTSDYGSLARGKKRFILRKMLAAEVEHLAGQLLNIAAGTWRYRDATREELSGALIELIACFPIYRTYARPESGTVNGSDAHAVAQATAEAQRQRPDLPPELFELLSNLLLLQQQGNAESDFVARFQQVSAAAMAKGVEDTAFYCFNRFIALNEVGGNPGRFGVSVDEFHQFCQEQQNHWPNSMRASSTHDTKRSEDVHARLNVLSEMPGAWREAVCRWSVLNEKHHRHCWPDANAEYLYYQTLVGAWPLSNERALAYMEKATHEAKEHTQWSEKNAEYDAAMAEFVTATLADAEFVKDLESFLNPLLKPACINSLAQTLLKLTAPGVPDIYQGTELWDLSLVDPDNRRPVNFAERQSLLAKAAALSSEEAWSQWQSGIPKLWLFRRVLNLRAQRPDLFASSAKYEPLTAQGQAAAHVVALKRAESLIAVVPRLILGLHDNWTDTFLELPSGEWHNELTGEILSQPGILLSGLLNKFPVALLVRKENS